MPERRDADQLTEAFRRLEEAIRSIAAVIASADFLAGMRRLQTSPGVTEAEAAEIATGILGIAEVSGDEQSQS